LAADHVIARISADISELRTELAKGHAEFRKFGAQIEKALPEDPFERLTRSAGSLAQIGASAAPFLKAGQSAAQFEADLRSLNTIIDKNDGDLAAYGEKLRTVSLELGTAQGASQTAKAAFAIAGSGFEDAADAAKVLETVLKATTAGGMKDAAPVAETLSGALKAYGASAVEAERFSNVMFTTIKDGITTFPELTATLGNVAPIAAAAGISFEELGAAIAVTTGKGINTSTAVDGLKGAITNLLAPSEQARKELDRLGVSVSEQSLKQKGLKNTLLEIAKANGGSSQSFKLILGDVQAFNAALALTGDGGAAFEKAMGNMAKSGEATDKALAERNKTFQASMDQFQVALESAGVAVGTIFLPIAKQLLDAVGGVVSAFATAPAPIQAAITTVGALGSAAIITTKAIALLTTVAQRETIALGLSSLAKALCAQRSIALTATLSTQAMAMAATEAAAIGLAGAQSTAAASAVTLSAGLGTIILPLAAITAFAASIDYMRRSQEAANAKAEEALFLQERAADAYRAQKPLIQSAANALREYAGNVDLAATAMAKASNVKDLTEGIAGLVDQLNQAQDKGDKDLVKMLSDRIRVLRGARQELVTAAAKAAEPAKTPTRESAVAAEKREKAEKEAAQRAEARRKEALAEDLSALEQRRKAGDLSAQQEIKALEELKSRHALTSDERRKMDEDIAAAQGRIQARNLEQWQKATERAREAAKQNMDLRRAALETERDAQKTVEGRLEVAKQLVDLEAEQALHAEKNAKNRKQILDNAEAQKKLLEQQAKDEAGQRDADLAAKRSELAKEQAVEEEAAQQILFDRRREQLDREAAAGKDVAQQRRRLEEEELAAAQAASERRLAMAAAEIEAKRKAADAGATPEEQALNAERAKLELAKAQRQAAEEKRGIVERSDAALNAETAKLREQLALLREQNTERTKGQATLGGVTGAEQLNENTGAWGVSRRQGDGRTADETEAELEGQIARNEGILNSRRTMREGAGASADPLMTTQNSLLEQIRDAILAGGRRVGATVASAHRTPLQPMGVPYQFQPNSSL
jgi:TP901 family phage tail tape measure protein